MNNYPRTSGQSIRQAVASVDNADTLASVARLYYLEGMGQVEIATIHGVSRSTISRMLTTAREVGIVQITVRDFDPRNRALEQALIDRFGLRRAVVIQGIAAGDTQNREAVGYFAAPIVEEWIAGTHIVGVAGGRTLGALVRAIKHQTDEHGLEVVQLMGMIGSHPSGVDASELSRSLAGRFNGDFHNINAPAFVEDGRARDLFLSHSQIRSVWSKFVSLDLALIGVGTLDESVFVDRQVLTDRELDGIQKSGAVGEICGHFFDAEGQECDSPFRDRVVSIGLDVLRRSKEVVAVTTGSRRQAAVRAALSGGLIHSLVIDDAGASAILERR